MSYHRIAMKAFRATKSANIYRDYSNIYYVIAENLKAMKQERYSYEKLKSLVNALSSIRDRINRIDLSVFKNPDRLEKYRQKAISALNRYIPILSNLKGVGLPSEMEKLRTVYSKFVNDFLTGFNPLWDNSQMAD